MLTTSGLARPSIATKLHGAVVLALAVVCGLAGVAIQFAAQTSTAAIRLHDEGLAPAILFSRAEVLLEESRRLVATALSPATVSDREEAVKAYKLLGGEAAALMRKLGYPDAHPLLRRLEVVTSQGSAVFDLARAESSEQQGTAAARYAVSSDDLRRRIGVERQQRVRASELGLEELKEQSRALTTWVLMAAGTAGLLIGPLGLFLLRRILKRMESVGAALGRLARNDTSVEIPDLHNRDEVGEFARSVAVFKSKSIELLQKKADLERLNVQLDAAINNMPLGLSMFDAQERLLVCNTRYAEMYQLPGELTLPGTVDCAHRDYRTKHGARHWEGDAPTDVTVQSSDPSAPMMIELSNERVIAVSRQPLKGGGWVALHEDVTERPQQEQKIIHLARHDPLTNLANRALFKEQLHRALQRSARNHGFAVLCLDLDRFKAVNDTLGHPIGDALLRQVSDRLLSCVRQGDLVARLGGDEFAIIQASVRDPSQPESLASRIVETVSNPYHIEGHRIDISTSIGITLAPRDGADADQLMKNADLALYRTKSRGRRGYSFFNPEMNDIVEVRRTLEADLRRALENDELDMCYQPIVALDTQNIAGFEALPRWLHPVRGAISAEELSGVAEGIGLAAELGEWILRRACADAAQWPAPVKAAVNIAPLQFKRNLLDLVLQALAETRLPANRLELEIGEPVLLQDSHTTLAMLYQLRQLGVRIVLDDFGTGYGSLSYLRSFPFDKIKIDRALIADTERSEDSASVVETIIGLSRKLGMQAVAEGIESEQQLDRVRAFGCAEGQGFFFSSGFAASEIELVLMSRARNAQHAA